MSDPQYVYSSDGRRGVIVQDQDPTTDDRRFLRVRFDDSPDLTVPAELLELRPDGAFFLNVGHEEMRQAANAKSYGGTASAERREVTSAESRITSDGAAMAAQTIGSVDRERVVVPVVAEELQVGKRTVETGVVRVRKLVREHEETIDQPITREEVQVERVPIGRIVDVAPQPRNEGETLIIPVLEEVLVVEKRVMLKEEVHVTWRRVEERSPQQVMLRSEEIVVERDGPLATDGITNDPSTYDQSDRMDSKGL